MVGEAYNAGQTIEQLAETWNVKHVTILNHLYRFCQEGYSLRPGDLSHLLLISEDQQARASRVFEELGVEFLQPIFEALNREVSYEDLHIMRLQRLSLLAERAKADMVRSNSLSPGTTSIVCLAISRKYSGCCIAGKKINEGRVGGWIRPVSSEATGDTSWQE